MDAFYQTTPDNQEPTEDKPKRHYPGVSGIPQELRDIPRWMGTRFERRKDDKTDKPPYRVHPGLPITKADKTHPDNWTTYEDALAAYESGGVDAIGFVFTKDDPFFVVDCDGVIDPDTGEIHPTAAEIIHTMGTYTELSCSRTGLHIIGEGQKPQWAGCKSKKMGPMVEIYDSKRFVVLTGERVGDHREPLERQEKLEWLCQKLWIKAERMNTRRPEKYLLEDVADEELLDRARSARTGAKFRRLYDQGDVSGYASASEADFALLNMLIFWTAGDPERIASLFERSALYRPGEKHRSYVQRSVRNALADYVGKFYRPRDVKKARKEDLRQEDPLAPYLSLLLDPSQWTGRRAASGYKAYAAMAALAQEHGIVDDGEELQIGCDTRRLAEVAGMSDSTVRQSALPYLVQELKLMRWKRGKGQTPGVFVLKNPASQTHRIKVATHFNAVSLGNAETTLNTLRLFIRMRRGNDKSATLLKLGMPAMFVAIALASAPSCGYSVEELVSRTGRRKDHIREAIKRLKAHGIIQESGGLYRLSREFARHYECALELSGTAYAERNQRRRHADDRARRNATLGTDRGPNKLPGKEHMSRVMERRRREERERWVEEQRQKVGATAATFITDELSGASAVNFHAMLRRFQEHGGNATELWRAVHNGPWRFYRETDGQLYVSADAPEDPEAVGDRQPSDEEAARIKRLISQGMKPSWARAEILGGGL